jgi:hypothetical protein
MPPPEAFGEPIGLADAFGVPILVRHSSPLLRLFHENHYPYAR